MITDNSRADALTDEQIAKALAVWFAPDAGSFESRMRAAILAASPVEQHEAAPCVHADDPKSCYRVRCQLGNKCVDDDMSPRQVAPSAPLESTGNRADDDKLERPARVGGRNYAAGALKQQVVGRAYAEYDRWLARAPRTEVAGAVPERSCDCCVRDGCGTGVDCLALTNCVADQGCHCDNAAPPSADAAAAPEDERSAFVKLIGYDRPETEGVAVDVWDSQRATWLEALEYARAAASQPAAAAPADGVTPVVGPVSVHRTHPNQAYVTLGFGSEELCSAFLKALNKLYACAAAPLPAAAAGQEAVAWQYRVVYQDYIGPWIHTTKEGMETLRDTPNGHCEVRDLYTTPPAQVATRQGMTDLAHEIYAAAQTAPGEGIEDATGRIETLLAAQQPEPRAEVTDDLAVLRNALTSINGIRNNIIGLHTLNWSEHVYPLVAALDAAGFEGMEYPEARAFYGTMLDRCNAAEKDAERYRLLRRGQIWSVINGIGDTLRADELDAAIDAARAGEAS
ncbi:hypothetical protein [Burkholderia vietnamiensis]|uniref:hypothetical protein n=1 Tax=Burkholderia vietnamiensis TaxID=60552 RepID=UPI001CF1E7CF|nr:hypothetical protein [Burkholderia vietnamiensis]MCA8195432.1 hypothetical protein [Burkholderia vietnamiensis]